MSSKRGLHLVEEGLERHPFPSESHGTFFCLCLEERFQKFFFLQEEEGGKGSES